MKRESQKLNVIFQINYIIYNQNFYCFKNNSYNFFFGDTILFFLNINLRTFIFFVFIFFCFFNIFSFFSLYSFPYFWNFSFDKISSSLLIKKNKSFDCFIR